MMARRDDGAREAPVPAARAASASYDPFDDPRERLRVRGRLTRSSRDDASESEGFATDDEVEVRDETDRTYYPAVVTRVHKDKTVDVLYDADETLEKRVERSRIPPKRIGNKRSSDSSRAKRRRQPGDRVR